MCFFFKNINKNFRVGGKKIGSVGLAETNKKNSRPNLVAFNLYISAKPQFATSAFKAVRLKEKNTSGDTDYAPKYAYYNWDRPTPSQTFDIVGQK